MSSEKKNGDAAEPEAVAPETKEASKPAAAEKPPKAEKPAAEKSEKVEPTVIGTHFVLPISSIAEYDNPRHEPSNLHDLGYTLFGEAGVEEPVGSPGKYEKYASLVHLALSDDLEKARKFCTLLEQHEGPIYCLTNGEGKVVLVATHHDCQKFLADQKDRKGWKLDPHKSAPQSIIELAENIRVNGQLDPVELSKNGGKYHGVDGGRRITSILYLHAKSRCLRHDKDENAPKKVWPATIEAIELKCKDGQLWKNSITLNLQRKQFNPLQEGRVYHEMLKRQNPATGKPYTTKEAAEELGVPAGTFRNREALWRPFKPAQKDPKSGSIIAPAKGLTDSDRRKVALGEMLATAASRKALGEQHYSETGTPSRTKSRGLPLKEMQKLFDESADGNVERRTAIAECMGLKLTQATKESDARIKAQDDKALQQHDRKQRRKKGEAA